jgi:hypothetical protein
VHSVLVVRFARVSRVYFVFADNSDSNDKSQKKDENKENRGTGFEQMPIHILYGECGWFLIDMANYNTAWIK